MTKMIHDHDRRPPSHKRDSHGFDSTQLTHLQPQTSEMRSNYPYAPIATEAMTSWRPQLQYSTQPTQACIVITCSRRGASAHRLWLYTPATMPEHLLTQTSIMTQEYHLPSRSARSGIGIDIAYCAHKTNWWSKKTMIYDETFGNDAKLSDLLECRNVYPQLFFGNNRRSVKTVKYHLALRDLRATIGYEPSPLRRQRCSERRSAATKNYNGASENDANLPWILHTGRRRFGNRIHHGAHNLANA